VVAFGRPVRLHPGRTRVFHGDPTPRSGDRRRSWPSPGRGIPVHHRTASLRSSYVALCAPALAVATTTMVPMATTPTLTAWTQKPHSSVIPSSNAASRIMMPVHVNDHATTVAASMVAGGAGSPPRHARDREESHRGDPAEQEQERAEVPTNGVAAQRPLLIERDRPAGTRAKAPVVGNETARDESDRPSKDDQIPDPQPRPRGVGFRNAVGQLVAAEVFIDLLQVFALSVLVVGQLRPAPSETHPWVQVSHARRLGAPRARAARRASGVAPSC
jgi:hypothetical protein